MNIGAKLRRAGARLAPRPGESRLALATYFLRSIVSEGPGPAIARAREYIGKVAVEQAFEPPDPSSTGLAAYVSACPGATRRYRCEHAVEQLAAAGHVAALYPYPGVDLEALVDGYRVVVLHRVPHDRQVEAFIRAARSVGTTVLFDADDLIVDESCYPEWHHYLTRSRAEQYFALGGTFGLVGRCLTLVDGATVSTDELAAELARTHPDLAVRVHRNVASAELVERSNAARTGAAPVGSGPHITFGYFSGSPTHDLDLAEAVPGLVEALGATPRARLLLVGDLTLPAGLAPFADQIRIVGFVPWQELPAIIGDIDVNLAPLERGTRFTEVKSELKFVEAALVDRPTVASAIGPWPETIDDGVDGLLCEGPDDWARVLCSLAEDSTRLREIGERARAKAHARYLPEHGTASLLATLEYFGVW